MSLFLCDCDWFSATGLPWSLDEIIKRIERPALPSGVTAGSHPSTVNILLLPDCHVTDDAGRSCLSRAVAAISTPVIFPPSCTLTATSALAHG
ncbi:hypothetical protein C8F01DRAFT_1253749 [Mycena amicta]|nr:hypothetical protein C8F01DRAFT_1253749 [Mycena amicta]